jgi:hypothetical protein
MGMVTAQVLVGTFRTDGLTPVRLTLIIGIYSTSSRQTGTLL